MIETVGENGVTVRQALKELSKHGLDFRTALNPLKNHYKAAGAERHAGTVVYYRKEKPKSEKKEESAAVRLAKKLVKRNVGEKQYNEVINHYPK